MTMWKGHGHRMLASNVALRGRDHLVPQRLEVRLGLDDVFADRGVIISNPNTVAQPFSTIQSESEIRSAK
jgi:hypothetical protein